MIDLNNIDLLVGQAESGTNMIIEIDSFLQDPSRLLKLALLNTKTQVDRWDLVCDILICNTKVENLLCEMLQINTSPPSLWGMNFHVVNNIDLDTILLMSTWEPADESVTIDKRVALCKINLEELIRINNLKAFW